MLKRQKLLSLSIIAFVLLFLVAIYYYYRLNSNYRYSRNRMVEYKCLTELLNEVDGSRDRFVNIYAGRYRMQRNNIFILKSEMVTSSSCFQHGDYKIGATDFFGYEIHFDQEGFISNVYFYKP